jgi:hypothetical protein
MRVLAGTVLTVIAGLAISACSSGPGSAAPAHPASATPVPASSSSVPPPRSDAAACREFRSWYGQFAPGERLDNTSKMVVLLIGASEAPPDPLRQELSVLESDVIKGAKATGSRGQAEEQKTVKAAHNVLRDCQGVTTDP